MCFDSGCLLLGGDINGMLFDWILRVGWYGVIFFLLIFWFCFMGDVEKLLLIKGGGGLEGELLVWGLSLVNGEMDVDFVFIV